MEEPEVYHVVESAAMEPTANWYYVLIAFICFLHGVLASFRQCRPHTVHAQVVETDTWANVHSPTPSPAAASRSTPQPPPASATLPAGLSADAVAALAKLRAVLSSRGLHDLQAFGCESEEETLLRYPRSRKGDVVQAADSYYATSKWREDSEVAALRRMAPSEALGCDVSVLRSVLPHAQRGVDRAGGPLIFKPDGRASRS